MKNLFLNILTLDINTKNCMNFRYFSVILTTAQIRDYRADVDTGLQFARLPDIGLVNFRIFDIF